MGVERLIRDLKDADKRLGVRAFLELEAASWMVVRCRPSVKRVLGPSPYSA